MTPHFWLVLFGAISDHEVVWSSTSQSFLVFSFSSSTVYGLPHFPSSILPHDLSIQRCFRAVLNAIGQPHLFIANTLFKANQSTPAPRTSWQIESFNTSSWMQHSKNSHLCPRFWSTFSCLALLQLLLKLHTSPTNDTAHELISSIVFFPFKFDLRTF